MFTLLSHSVYNNSLAYVVGLTSLLVSLTACDDDPMRNGAEALYAHNLERAEAAFQLALKEDKNNVEAKRRLADVALERKDFAQAEKILNEIAGQLPEQNRNTSLTIEQKVTHNMLTQQYTRLYVSWIATADRKESPERYRHIFTEGIKYAPADTQLNAAAVDYYSSVGDKFVNDGKELLGIENYRSAMNYSMPNETRNDIEGKISKARRLNFDKVFARKLARAKETLAPPYSWNEAENAIEMTLEYSHGSRKTKDVSEDAIRAEAIPLIESSIRKLMAMIFPLPAELNASELFIPKYRIGSIEVKRKIAILHVFIQPAELAASTFLSVAKFDKNMEESRESLPSSPPDNSEEGSTNEPSEEETQP